MEAPLAHHGPITTELRKNIFSKQKQNYDSA
jgi:hypothetical protein